MLPGAILLLIAAYAAKSAIKVVHTGQVYVLERLGQFHKVLEPGWHFTIPFVDFVKKKISTKQQILDVPPQAVISKDNVTLTCDNVVFFKVLDAKDAVYNIENYREAIMYSITTNMRAVLGNLTLDEILSGRETINTQLLQIVDSITDAYGVKILSCEIKNIDMPVTLKSAMETEMKAERDKRARILESEGKKQAEIARAQGEKEARILEAEAEKEANIRKAEGLRESQLLEAEGKAKAIEAISRAEAEAIHLVNEAIMRNSDANVIAYKQVEAMKEMAHGAANKIIMPTDAVSSFGSIAAIADVIKGNNTFKN